MPGHLPAPELAGNSEILTTSKKTVSARCTDNCLRRLSRRADGPREAAESSKLKSVTEVRHSEAPPFCRRVTIQLRVTSIIGAY